MLAKIGFVVGGIALVMFAMARVESLATHRGFVGSAAWAEDLDTFADYADGDSQPAAVPNVSGSYSGPAHDHKFGAGTLAVDITQNGSALTGNWETDLDGGLSGPMTGKVKSNGEVTLNLKINGLHHCTLNAHGTFEHGNEIAGVYHNSGCSKPDHGNFDVTD
jgi:hypothetical protein